MNLVSLERVVKGYGQRVLLDGVSAGVAAGDSIGVVGRNGAGKSTLLALLAGSEEPDRGRVTRARDLRIGHLPQQDRLSGTVAKLVAGDRQEHEWAGDPRIRAVIAALLPGIDFGADAQRLSGGEARRVALAALLARDHDLLLLDEPTNHLDTDAVDWLARFLSGLSATMVVVTHDRWFLDTATNRTWELAGGQVHSYDGGYAAYVLARAERARIAGAAERRRRNLLRKELAWLRHGPPARTSKPRFRVEAANALIAGEPPPRDGVELVRLATARLGKTVIDAEDVSVRAGERVLLDHVTWQLGPGERVGLAGPNGSGKTTLLRLLAGYPEGSRRDVPDVGSRREDDADAADVEGRRDAPDRGSRREDHPDAAGVGSRRDVPDVGSRRDVPDRGSRREDHPDAADVGSRRDLPDQGSRRDVPDRGSRREDDPDAAGVGSRREDDPDAAGVGSRPDRSDVGRQREDHPDAAGTTSRPGSTSAGLGPGYEGAIQQLKGRGHAEEGGERGHRGESGTEAGCSSELILEGRVVRGKTVRLGYLPQDDEGLDPVMSARELVAGVRGNARAHEGAGSVGMLLERLGLRGDTQWAPAGELSGGERRRVQVLRVLVDEPNVLFLDEPTNDLDVDTLTELEDLLDGWPGSLLVVSHDRYFLERVTDHVVALLGDGNLSFLGGGIDEYLARRAAQDEASTRRERDTGRQRDEGPPAPGPAAARRTVQKELQRLERQIDRLTKREAELTVALAESATDYIKLTELGEQLRTVQAEKAQLENRWFTVAEEYAD